MQFNAKKRKRTEAEGFTSNVLLPDEVTPQIRAAAAEHSEKQARSDKLHASAKRKKVYHTRPPDPLRMNRAAVFFDATVSDGHAAPLDTELVLRSLRMITVHSRASAEVIVTRNPSEG